MADTTNITKEAATGKVKVSGSVKRVTDEPDYGAGTTTYVVEIVHRKGGSKYCVETTRDITGAIKKGDRVVTLSHLEGGDKWHFPARLSTFDVITEGDIDLVNEGDVEGTLGTLEEATDNLCDLFITPADGEPVCIKVYSEFFGEVKDIEEGKTVKVTFRLHTHTYKGQSFTRLIMTGIEEVA